MDVEGYLRFVAALALVLGLIAAATWAARRFGLAGRLPMVGRGARRLGVVEAATLDPKHRLVLVRRDDVEHLLLLGPAGATVVESGIAAPPVDSGAAANAAADQAAPGEAVPSEAGQ